MTVKDVLAVLTRFSGDAPVSVTGTVTVGTLAIVKGGRLVVTAPKGTKGVVASDEAPAA